MNFEELLAEEVLESFQALYNAVPEKSHLVFQKTRKEFEGDFTLVVFPFLKLSGKNPEQTAKDIGEALAANKKLVSSYNVVKGFLNLSIHDQKWFEFFSQIAAKNNFGSETENSSGKCIMLEYSSPNTNKPLHLGHVRNNLLGYSVASILKANGHRVIKTNIVNDRGVHICKSMLAWKRWGNNETPETSMMKGDHLVGKYYVEFDKQYKLEIEKLVKEGLSKEEAEKKAPLMLEVQEMLRKWEANDKDVVELWSMMNAWVYKGFDETYKLLGVDFDKIYYESNTYLLGKSLVEEGLSKGVFYKKEDNSVWIDLTGDGLDHKLVQRSDGTSVYMTQDLGTATERFREYTNLNQLIYTVGNEQDYHFKVLFLILFKLGYAWAKECFHLSYGMVELPEGKMKSREGTVVDADELLTEMFSTAEEMTRELGKIDDFTAEEANELYKTIGLGALKYFMLKVDPKKKMMFDPKESVDFNGNTGPFIQYTHARICSILRKAERLESFNQSKTPMNEREKELLRSLYEFPIVIKEAGKAYSPALIANYCYELVKVYNQFYHDCPILKEENVDIRNFRLQLSSKCAEVIKNCMCLLGVKVPERM